MKLKLETPRELDLGEYGLAWINELSYDPENNSFVANVHYIFREWVFDDAELYVELDEEPKMLTGENILNAPWKHFTIEPTEETKVVGFGEPDELIGTTFERILKRVKIGGQTYRIPVGWEVKRIPAACHSEEHFSHPFCFPRWEEEVKERGGIILEPPRYENGGWVATVAFPREGR